MKSDDSQFEVTFPDGKKGDMESHKTNLAENNETDFFYDAASCL